MEKRETWKNAKQWKNVSVNWWQLLSIWGNTMIEVLILHICISDPWHTIVYDRDYSNYQLPCSTFLLPLRHKLLLFMMCERAYYTNFFSSKTFRFLGPCREGYESIIMAICPGQSFRIFRALCGYF